MGIIPEGIEVKVKMLKNIEAVKKAVGIDSANCQSCVNFGTDDNGNFPESMVSWDICHRFPTYQNLKSFPFKKEMECWLPEFWHSKYTDLIKKGEHEEVLVAIDEFNKAIEVVDK